ncbi:hybrid sensor histidine kinase/response regulator [Nostoc sp. 'Lobaria pulmonaria (5183) cyanobiont']|uniref:hybrid sensor histidine kinase/response regulator n=1 Tax=Nostoc sp. 'Lobaria pulmonaria (5183) cyanobiont' TaxID=1618022 RepID=UPI000CF34151|nr:response regulator [Nostoc sp. 'Lobaria pulmonaria (5183) cyanobiont']AVH72089.1 histidine kinase [Nostoc sp. 'Lobaria pulmonaria (5183) cyanobiont']
MLPEQQQRILGYFIEEARDHLNTIEQGLLNLEGTLNDPEMISEVFRAAHSIKGGAAMLGLTSIQHTSHRLEDCFKVLKDNPVQIDQKLESLFLGVSDTLKSLLEHLSGPYGLSEDAANTLMSETEPVFQWLYQHLELLVEQGKSGAASSPDATKLTTSVENVSTLTELFLRRDIPDLAENTHQESIDSVAPQETLDARGLANAARSPVTAKESNNWSEFQAQVLQTLREMLQLFKQTTTPSTRQNLQQCCHQLVKLGETWNLSKWCGLCQAAASAIGNPENTYLTLAKIVITEIKQAQELVLQGREAEIAISQQLEALLSFAEIELLEVTPDLFDEQSAAFTESESILSGNTEPLAQKTEELNLDKDNSDSYANVSDERPYLQLQGTPLNESRNTSFTFTTHDEAHPISNNLDPNGPEVGIAELNTLADLFDGETPELDDSWHQEETLDIVATDDFGIDLSCTEAEDAHNDLSDLLSFNEDINNALHPITTATTEDLSLLFGTHFLEKDNSEPQNKQTSATPLELSDINELDINLDSSSSEILQDFIDIPSDTNQTPGEIVQNSAVEDFLKLQLDDEEVLPTGEVTQAETEPFASVELSINQQNNFDNLFLETKNANWVEEITPSDYIELPQPTDLSLDNLFAGIEEQTQLATSEPEISDLFDTPPATEPEFSQSENDLSNFWNQETTEEKDEFDSLIEQNLERALDESLFTAAADDIFADNQQSIPSPIASFDIEEDFDINFQHEEQLDLILSSDSGDNLFDELTSSSLTISPIINDTSTPETPLFAQHPGEEVLRPQQPEYLDFVPEFTNQTPDISAVDLEVNSLGSFDENPQLLFEVATNELTYIQIDTTENTVDELSETVSFRENSDSESSQAHLDNLFDSFDENPQLLFEVVATNELTYIQIDTTENTVDELSETVSFRENSDSESSQAHLDNLFDSFDENPQLLFEVVATNELTYIQMDTTENTVDELSETISFRENSDSASPEEQPGDLFGSFDENPQLLFEVVATNELTYIQMDTTENTVDELSETISFGENSDSEFSPAQLDDLFGSEDVITNELTYIQMDTTANTVDELSKTVNFGESSDSASPEEQPGDLFSSLDENPQLLFEVVATKELTYIQMDTTENTVDELSQTISFGENSDSEFSPAQLDDLFDSEDVTTDELTYIQMDTTENTVDELSQTISLRKTSDSAQTNPEVLENEENSNLKTTFELRENTVVENNLLFTETTEIVAQEDEFADLAALLGEDVAPISKAKKIPEVDFAALEELLSTDNNSDVYDGLGQRQPFNTQPVLAKNAISSPAIKDEFGDLEKLLAEANQTISHSTVVKSNTNKTTGPSTRRAARFEETMKVPVKQLDDMSNLVGELVVNRNTLEQDHERLRQSLDNLLIQVQQLSDVGARMQELYERSLLEASLLAGRKKKDPGLQASDSNADRGFSELEMDRFTPFHTLSQQMIERIVRVRESASDIDFVTEETERVARQFRQVTTQLQEGLTRARMVPFAQTIDRWRRGVRDNAIKCGKQVELVIVGGDTLIDKMILDHLTDPLTHMLNNAIAHGIETPEERQAASKPPVGIITIRAFHQGNQTIISVGDDGAGIDSARVKAKAVKIGMITEAQAKAMSRLEVYDLLFQSGFTIKDQADEISGRGVGMDVVRSEISEIRGTVNTDSAIGKGTTFTIRLPLTLSICKALCCVSDRARIAFPMDGVEDTLDIPVKNIQYDANGQSFISWRDTVLPFRPLRELLTFNRQISRGNVYGGTRDDDMVSVVVVRSANTLIALQIDLVLSEQEIVIKQFEGPAPKPIGVAGATVLGDGRIMPIADVLEIIDIFQGRISTQIGGSSWQQKTTPPDTSPTKIDPTVLIVDDSITVRELLSLTFNKAGYRVEQARDGQEAWDKLRSGLPCDIVFCDIEMPRCDGLELLSRIQKDSNLNHLPIAMLTSRGADKHRQIAAQLGASGYFTKPYLEEALLEAAARMLKGEKLVS